MAKALSFNEIQKRLEAFVHDWAEEPGDERQQAQQFVRELLTAYGVNDKRAASFEYRAKRSTTGKQGYIDALIPGVAVIEMKSAGNDLSTAEEQALDYVDALTDAQQPRYIMTSDFRRIRLLDLNWPEHDTGRLEFDLTDLPKKADALGFLGGYGMRPFGSQEQEQASIKAARIMAGLYETLAKSGYPDDEAAPFLMRLLFCLYADDAGLWEHDLFREFLATRTSADGTDLGPLLTMLFQEMNNPAGTRSSKLDGLMARFPYVNGRVFAGALSIPAFDSVMRDSLISACDFNWSAISPAVFGSLAQAIKTKEARRELGEHYTTETNILKVIEPMFLDELRQRHADAGHDVQALTKLRKDIGAMRFLDPACGCGNFLVIAYRELRRLDLQILRELQAHEDSTEHESMFFTRDNLNVSLDHFHGIEIGEWEAAIARTVLHLIDHQANQEMAVALGYAPDPLPLDKIDTITVGNAVRIDWADIVEPTRSLYIMGNPPFRGHKERNRDQTDDIQLAWRRKNTGHLDYVTCWYAKAIELFEKDTYDGEFAFVSTNSITQGEQVPLLFGRVFSRGWRIKFAHRTFSWSSEAPDAAAVHCVIIGFDRHPRWPAYLYTYADIKGQPTRTPVRKQISGYLIDGPNVLVESRAQPLSPSLPVIRAGSTPIDWNGLQVTPEQLPEVMSDHAAAKYLRPYLGGDELINNLERWCLWMAGPDWDPADVRDSPVLTKRLKLVRDKRSSSGRKATQRCAATPYLFGEIRQPSQDYLAIPQSFSDSRSYMTAAFLSASSIASTKLFTVVEDSDLAFAVVSSSMFITWQKAVGGRIKSDPSLSSGPVWNTFPLSALDDATRSNLIAAGHGVLEARALHPERSLADHYHPLTMDPALLTAHRDLDAVMDKAMGARKTLADNAERLAVLLDNYQKMTGTSQKRLPRR